MPTGLARYGLEQNPFLYGELNALRDEVAERLLARVDGFQVIDTIDAKVDAAVAKNQPLFVMVAGGEGSGRTSLVYWLLWTYAKHRGIERERAARLVERVRGDQVGRARADQRELEGMLARTVEAIAERAARHVER